MQKQRISTIIIELFLLFSVLLGTIFVNIGLVGIFFVFFMILLLNNKICLLNEDIHIILLFYLLFFFSFAIAIFMIYAYGINYIKHYPSTFGRMMNIIIYLTIFLFVINRKNNQKITTEILLNSYLIGCYILISFAVWQILNYIFDVPYPNFETRNEIHTMDSLELLPFMRMRVTSISREPAYLIPSLMDAIIILLYSSKKKLMIGIIIVITFFTLSLSGYVNVFLLGLLIIFFSKPSKKKFLFLIIMILCFISLFIIIQGVIATVLQRLNPKLLFASGRLQQSILPIKYMFNNISFFNILFGYGNKGYVYISRSIFGVYENGDPIAATSHVIFVDFLIEYGIIGELFVILLFYYLYKLATKTYIITKNRLSQVLCLNLIVTSLYSSDYASARFTIMLIIILCLYKDARKQFIR
jgi:hypothetical protein